MSTITTKQQASIASKLAGMHLPSGLGDEHSACSIAAINLALSGRLTDEIPDCMSEVIGRWIIVIQDAMPGALRNSEGWKSLLPLAAGTGRDREQERLDIILDWLWGTVLPSLQTLADQEGFGEQWQKMTTERTAKSAEAAADAARAEAAVEATEAAHRVATAAAVEAAEAEWATGAAARAEEAVEAAEVAAEVARAVAAEVAAEVARAAAAVAAVEAAARATAWADFDPCGLLERLIRIGNNAQENIDPLAG
jgi:pyruvate/2-oxoglutarate dehydrogenase complex dihydrolipoamide acyltransferase (E2) component